MKNSFELWKEGTAIVSAWEKYFETCLKLFGIPLLICILFGWVMPTGFAFELGGGCFLLIGLAAIITTPMIARGTGIKNEAKRLYGTNSEEYW